MSYVHTWAAHLEDDFLPEALSFLGNHTLATDIVDDELGKAYLPPAKAKQDDKAAREAQRWQDAVNLYRLRLDLGDISRRQQSLTLRSSGTKRKASVLLADRISKNVRKEDQASSDLEKPCVEETESKSQSVSNFRQHYTPLKVSKTTAVSGDATRLHVVLPSGNRLLELELKSLSSEDRKLLDHAILLQRPDITCPCRFVSSLSLQPTGAGDHLILQLDLYWQNATNSNWTQSMSRHPQSAVLFFASLLAPTEQLSTDSQWTPRLFYDNVYTPAHDSKSFGGIEVHGLRTGLYSFQGRTLEWLLSREQADNCIQKSKTRAKQHLTNGFVKLKDVNGRPCLFNGWLQVCTTSDGISTDPADELKGGILAEEMGLGKTVEILALIQTHKRPSQPFTPHDRLRRSSSTLIIAPKAIIEQWKEEIATHAPSLEIMTYDGIKAHGPKTGFSDSEMVEVLCAHDVVLVTYDVLSREIWFAKDPPERSMRYPQVKKRRKSPLVQIDWWRVVLDEAQMIERGVTHAAEVAVQLPRQNAWAVTGTPIRKDSHDLLGLLTFLRLEPFCRSKVLWGSLVTTYQPLFKELMQKICLRHSKDQVKAELQLPAQKRVVITVPFTAIEEQNYAQLYEQMVTECALDMDGNPEPNTNSPDSLKVVGLMRSWLARLRQICLHPEVGEKNRRALGRGDRAPLRTVSDVLQVMCEQNESALRSEERIRLQAMLRRGQVLENAKFPEQAMAIWKKVEQEAARNIEIDRSALADAEREEGLATIIAASVDVQGEEGQGENHITRLKIRLRASLEVKHIATFFIANAIFQIKTNQERILPESDAFSELEKQEVAKYEEAKQIRRELLSNAAGRARDLMATVSSKVRANNFVHIPTFTEPPVVGGIETRKYIDQLNRVMGVLEQQRDYIVQWRAAFARAVSSPLVDQEETELTGEEYEKSTKEEDQIHAYMEAMRLLIMDRSQVLTGQKNTNVRREASNLLRNAIAGEGHAPELMKKLLLRCNDLRLGETREGEIEISLRGLIAQLHHHHGSIDYGRSTSKKAEKAMIDRILHHLKPEVTEQQKAINALEKELDLFSDIVNSRVEYYKQLQDISDLVAPLEEELDASEIEIRLTRMKELEAQGQKRVDKLKARAKYLEHLRDDSSADNIERKCIICQDHFDTGCLTTCGHVYCKECILLWWRQHRSCPTCKASLAKTDLQPITYKPLTVSVHEQGPSTISNASLSQGTALGSTSIYSEIGPRLLDEIKAIDLRGSYGTKIDTLARHLLWVRQHDPGAKAVVFSQFRDFLEVLEHAFTRFGIGWSSIEDGAKGIEKFKRDAGVECLLLHAKAQSSGLNLVNATHVFICEPLINTAIELQVIARVHRIGQHSTTTVWMYLVENTVEEAIYEISVDRRMAHIKSGQLRQPVKLKSSGGAAAFRDGDVGQQGTPFDEKIEAANSLEMEEAPAKHLLASGRSSGEQVPKEDIWQCLFKYKPTLQNSVVGVEDERVTGSFLAGEAADSRRVVQSSVVQVAV